MPRGGGEDKPVFFIELNASRAMSGAEHVSLVVGDLGVFDPLGELSVLHPI
jgi:hypothetical protein